MAEFVVSSVLSVLFAKLLSPELHNFATREGVLSKLKKWEKTLKMIDALLVDAEEKNLTNGAVKMWLDELLDWAYDAEDILDEYATEALRRKLKMEEHQGSTIRARKLIPACCFGFTPSSLWSDFSMRSKIDDIAGRRSNASQQRLPTTCLPIEPVVYGRDEDRAKILEMVLRHDEPSGVNFGVIPIVGMGGIGKTTLAQQVYNDKKVEDFNPKAWVCVSDDFDVLRISKAILELITFSSCDVKEYGAVKNRLKDALNGKKFLIILDDVWSRSYESWESLKAPFMVGAPGSKIIVTTRSTEVALTMRPHERYDLKLLSDDDCWSMFVKHAFNSRGNSAHWNLDMIREKVVQKCKGLPLAAKTLDGLLYYKETEDEWMDILNSKVWDLKANILPVLRLSYNHLPSHLKRCFAYCAILPKDYEFEVKEIVFLWMAEGLIQQSSNNEQLEELGGEYFHDLLSRSIFQISSTDSSKFIMHNLVNDLALMVSEKLSFRLEGEMEFSNQLKVYEKTRYASHICHEYNDERKFEVFNDAMHLRTHLSVPQINDWVQNCYISNKVVFDLLSRFKKLRVLSLQKYYIVELPDSIGGLRLLRYLNLSNCKIRSLPESVNSMCNLQTLILRNCRELLKWPYSMGNLINLRHLDILGAYLIKEMPMGIGKWENLRTLSNFIVGIDSKSSLKDLKHLKFLCGELHISRLENVIDFEDMDVILSDKKDIKVLLMEWGYLFDYSQDEVPEKVLLMLRPHRNLEELTITCYEGSKFPSWVGDRSFSKMTVLKLEDCKKCTSLPSLGVLGSLKSLTIKGMMGIKSIGSEFYGEHCSNPFQSLVTLSFETLEEWEVWDPVIENGSFPKLQELSIVNCPKLSKRLPNNLSSLKKLVIHRCEQLVVSLSNMPRLCELNIDGCKKIVCSGLSYYESLESMSLSNTSEFGDWPRQEFRKVQSFTIEGCEELIEQWQNEIFLEKPPQRLHSLTSLRELNFKHCNTLTTLLEGIKQKNVHVEELRIERCDSLNFIFRGQLPQYLKKLDIIYCEKLQCLLDDGNEDTCSSSSSMMHKENVNTTTSHLEYFFILGCQSLTFLPSIDQLRTLFISNCSKLTTLSLTELTALLPKGQLPETLEILYIDYCEKLESIVEKFHNNKSLYEISIFGCGKLKSLPEDLETLSSLRSMQIINCGGFVSFPNGGFPDSNLRVRLRGTEKLQALPSGIQSLSSLVLIDCPNMSLSGEGLPTNLVSLLIHGFPKLNYLPFKDFEDHPSLEYLRISYCTELTSLPSLPSSLLQLNIYGCPKLTSLPNLPSTLEIRNIGLSFAERSVQKR
ncbi:hypothetical protein ACOSP7_030082 [Xanthoceras sorbifolium]